MTKKRLQGSKEQNYENRLKLLIYLIQKEGANYSSIEEFLGVTQSTLTTHLKKLKNEGFITKFNEEWVVVDDNRIFLKMLRLFVTRNLKECEIDYSHLSALMETKFFQVNFKNVLEYCLSKSKFFKNVFDLYWSQEDFQETFRMPFLLSPTLVSMLFSSKNNQIICPYLKDNIVKLNKQSKGAKSNYRKREVFKNFLFEILLSDFRQIDDYVNPKFVEKIRKTLHENGFENPKTFNEGIAEI